MKVDNHDSLKQRQKSALLTSQLKPRNTEVQNSNTPINKQVRFMPESTTHEYDSQPPGKMNTSFVATNAISQMAVKDSNPDLLQPKLRIKDATREHTVSDKNLLPDYREINTSLDTSNITGRLLNTSSAFRDRKADVLVIDKHDESLERTDMGPVGGAMAKTNFVKGVNQQ